jgi:hypothetical protein
MIAAAFQDEISLRMAARWMAFTFSAGVGEWQDEDIPVDGVDWPSLGAAM